MNCKFILVLSFLFFNVALIQAQLCSGSLGDPVVKIDFGSGTATHGTALGTGITSYTWTTADFPNDGSYTVESTTNTAGTWWTTTDHTGGGYMMVVNASLSTTDYFYKNTVSGLCPDTTYEFAAWIMNLLRNTDNSKPNITFTIESTDGTILGTYNTGDIALSSSAVWKQYGFYFTTPAGVSTVVIRMRNNKAGAAPGNDIALDDITFRACGPTVISAVQNDTDTSLEVCKNELKSYTLIGQVGSSVYANPAYQWQVSTNEGTTWIDITGANSTIYTFLTNSVGTYMFRMATAQSSNISSASCRVVSNVLTFRVSEGPDVPTFTIIQPNCTVGTGTITVTAPSEATYSIDGTNYQSSTVFSGLTGGDYNLTSKGISGCVSNAAIAHINTIASSNSSPIVSVTQPVICNNPFGTITITSLDYEYSFDNGATWTSSNSQSGFAIGTYQVKTRSISNCESAAVSVDIVTPPGYPPTPIVSFVQPDCITSTGTITVSDAAAAYSFDNGVTWTTANSKNNLNPGIYPVMIKNALGCTSLVANPVTVNAYVNNESLPVAAISQTFCIQQSATIDDIVITGANVKWYDAPINGNIIARTTMLESGTYYASQTISVCESQRIPVAIKIQDTAVPTGASLQEFCSTQKPTIASLEVFGASVIWYDSALNGVVLPSTTDLVNGETYYASQTINGCESVNRLAVSVSIVNPSVIVQDVSDLICDDLNDGTEIVNIAGYNAGITTCASCTFTYYTSLSGADNQIATEQITAIANYSLSLGTNIIYVRIDSDDQCYQVVQLVLTLVGQPIISIPDRISVCEKYTVTINAGSGFDSYLWSNGATTSSLIVSEAGDYWITVTQNHGNTICSATKKISVELSNIATISSVETQDWTDTENAIVIGLSDLSLGSYEYSIDGINYQDSATFSGLTTGDYIVYVKDKNGCGIANQEVFILNYPKFFTPNGDGYNDTWAVNFSESEPGLITKIFDRYGKLIKELSFTSAWNGTLNNHELPSTDYWFVVSRANGKVYKGHFSLKR